jgi:hypothetical protein
MAQQPSIPPDLPTDVDLLAPSPTPHASHVSGGFQVPSARRPHAGRQARVRTHAISQVLVVDGAGRLRDVVLDLDYAIQIALAERSRGVVCDLSAMLEGAEPVVVEVLATVGRHVRDWPGNPLAVACPDPQIREALRAHPLGRHLVVTASLLSAMTAVLATRTLAVRRLPLASGPTAPLASRDFVTRTLVDWKLSPIIPFAGLVITELVANSTMNAGTRIEVSIVWDRGAVRLAVRDHGPALPGQRPSNLDLHRRRLSVVAVLSRAFGLLPTADGGTLAWAVLEAPRPRLSSSCGTHDSTHVP